jgi:RAB protein geranylgeranyltransferase component A
MYKDIDNKQFDYIIIGTSLCESILSAYLAKNGKKVIHLDQSKFYGGDCKNFSLKDLDQCSYQFIFRFYRTKN